MIAPTRITVASLIALAAAGSGQVALQAQAGAPVFLPAGTAAAAHPASGATPAARAAMGGTAAEAEIESWVTETNGFYYETSRNEGTRTTMSLCLSAMEEIAHTEDTHIADDLIALRKTADGIMDSAHDLHDKTLALTSRNS